MYTRCTIQISIRYYDLYTEILPHEMESTEIAVEGCISPMLAELFGGQIIVDDVTIQHFASNNRSDSDLSHRS